MCAANDNVAKVLLKARPTAAQLKDRLGPPWPDGLEFYLDRQDIIADDWLELLLANLRQHEVPEGFVYVVEGPLRSLDGSFFDLSEDSPGNRETLRRLVTFGATIGAKAAVIHAIAPTTDRAVFNDIGNHETLDRSLTLLRFYRDTCLAHGITPTLENIPPVARMRESKFMHSVIGMEPLDLVKFSRLVPGVKTIIDVSHAQLYLNAVNLPAELVPSEWWWLIDFIQRRATVRTIADYIDSLDKLLVEAHISNAAGLYGEGLAYDDGDLAMDAVVHKLSTIVQYLVTETLEPNPDIAVGMREAQRRMMLVLRGGTG